MTTLEDFEEAAEKEKKGPSHPKRLALTPLGRIVLRDERKKVCKKGVLVKKTNIPQSYPAVSKVHSEAVFRANGAHRCKLYPRVCKYKKRIIKRGAGFAVFCGL